jgi:hypothetical protein
LIHGEERYPGFLQQGSHQTDRDRIPEAGSDQDIEAGDLACAFIDVCR